LQLGAPAVLLIVASQTPTIVEQARTTVPITPSVRYHFTR
jgi:hypothetical protein